MGDVAAGVPERLGRLPRDEVDGGALRDHAAAACRALGVAGGDEHPPEPRPFVAEHEGIAPVARLVAGGRAEGVHRMPLPGAHAVAAGRVRHDLECSAVVAEPVGILARVERVVHAVGVEHDAAGVDVVVGGGRPARGDRDAGLGELHEIVGDDPVPGHALSRQCARLVQIEEVELAVLLPGDDVAHPGALRPVEPSLVHDHSAVSAADAVLVNRLRRL